MTTSSLIESDPEIKSSLDIRQVLVECIQNLNCQKVFNLPVGKRFPWIRDDKEMVESLERHIQKLDFSSNEEVLIATPVLGMFAYGETGYRFTFGDHQALIDQYQLDSEISASSFIREALRNVVQHASSQALGQISEGPWTLDALVGLAEFRAGRDASEDFLMVIVADEGMGLGNPQEDMVDGNGGISGDQHQGMMVELGSVDLEIISDNKDNWWLFDRANSEPIVDPLSDRTYVPADFINLPVRPDISGCMKIGLIAKDRERGPNMLREALARLV